MDEVGLFDKLYQEPMDMAYQITRHHENFRQRAYYTMPVNHSQFQLISDRGAEGYVIGLRHNLTGANVGSLVIALGFGMDLPLQEMAVPSWLEDEVATGAGWQITGGVSGASNLLTNLRTRPKKLRRHHVVVRHGPAICRKMTLSYGKHGSIDMRHEWLYQAPIVEPYWHGSTIFNKVDYPTLSGGKYFTIAIWGKAGLLYRTDDGSLPLTDWAIDCHYDDAQMRLSAHEEAPQGLYQGLPRFQVKLHAISTKIGPNILRQNDGALRIVVRATNTDDSWVAVVIDKMSVEDFALSAHSQTGHLEAQITLVSQGDESHLTYYRAERQDG